MEKTQIKVLDYYANDAYFSFMPRPIYDALETAFINGDEFATVDKALFDQMIIGFNTSRKS